MEIVQGRRQTLLSLITGCKLKYATNESFLVTRSRDRQDLGRKERLFPPFLHLADSKYFYFLFLHAGGFVLFPVGRGSQFLRQNTFVSSNCSFCRCYSFSSTNRQKSSRLLRNHRDKKTRNTMFLLYSKNSKFGVNCYI